MPEAFELMSRRTGSYSLPWLIRLYDIDETEELFFINDTQDRVHETVTYKKSSFNYQPGKSEIGFTGTATLEIAVPETDEEQNKIINLLETYRVICLDVIGCLLKDGTISEIKAYSHKYGTANWDGKQAKFSYNREDILDMTFPALVFSHYNNKGN